MRAQCGGTGASGAGGGAGRLIGNSDTFDFPTDLSASLASLPVCSSSPRAGRRLAASPGFISLLSLLSISLCLFLFRLSLSPNSGAERPLPGDLSQFSVLISARCLLRWRPSARPLLRALGIFSVRRPRVRVGWLRGGGRRARAEGWRGERIRAGGGVGRNGGFWV